MQIQAPRYTYLPLLLQGIRENLVDLALDDKAIAELDESQWWFEEDGGEGPHFDAQGACKWSVGGLTLETDSRHWPIDLIELNAAIARTAPRSETPSCLSPEPPTPLRLVLHLSSPPAEKFNVPAGIEACKSQFVNQVKEADFVRWGNTKRVTGLRRGDLEAGWDGVVSNDFDLHARLATRVVPLPIPVPAGTPPTSSGGGSNVPSRPPSTEPGATSSGPKLESAYAARSLPIKIYLPDGAPAMQHVVPPLGSDGNPTTLITFLRQHLPLLFPAVSDPYVQAQPLAQGIVLPPDADVAWLAACMAGADGWFRLGIRLVAE